MSDRVVSCHIAAAFIHCQLGEERNAISLATVAMANPALLPPEALARALYVRALAHSRLGELDTALQLIEGKEQELAQMAPGDGSWLPALVAWVRAQVLWKVFLYRNHQDLWCGPPPDSGLVRPGGAAPDSASLYALLDRVGRQLPPGIAWPYSELLRLSLEGLESGRREAAAVVRAIERIGIRHQARNPPVAGWAWLSCALVHCSKRQHALALQAAMLAKSTARTYQLEGLHRNALVYEYHLQETQGDFAGALSTLKALNIMRLKSMAISPYLEKSRCTALDDPRLHDLEPAYVRRALQYIEDNLDKKLRVQAIADHCRVSRRTLEVSFRNSRSCSIGEYIRQSRIHLAAESLLTTDQSIGQISSRLGYSSLSAFSRDFSGHYGVPPSLWIRHHRSA
ncbi:Regulatory protein soxS [Delftia tsuruhatensis]|uniref:helix-turn-helix domain-containing protein n=1 Tax=Delftia tsuruhatensis TaxID=180282 RepID=UPI001E81797D|nr:AraC family transcriptional regulator [Delftia tsuruhatensis]CAB5720501.1 Regulatory protein soxS [Delftia tsuruhatensis]CAC9681577.1 Regulatory protein soxS [Delftia tsuruhatensis]